MCNEVDDVAKNISHQSVESDTWFSLSAFIMIQEERDKLEERLLKILITVLKIPRV